MFWSVILHCLLAGASGVLSFWLVMTVKPLPALVAVLGPVIMAAVYPEAAVGALCGAWAAMSIVPQTRESIVVPDESLGWRRVLRDAGAITLGMLVGLTYMYKVRNHCVSGVAVATGLLLCLAFLICYLHATAWDIPRRLRIKHGYSVGLLVFVPWAVFLARLGWVFLGLGFLTLLILPPFILATLEARLARSARRPRRRYRAVRIKMPR